MKPSMREIARAAAEHFNITIDELRFGCRKQKFSWPRHVAMTLSHYMSARSLPDIGQFFGGKHHTTTIHAINAVEEWARDNDETLRDLISIAAYATGMSIDRQSQERAWAQEIRSGQLLTAMPLRPEPRRILVPERAVIRTRRRPVTLPSEFAPPSKARLMGARA